MLRLPSAAMFGRKKSVVKHESSPRGYRSPLQCLNSFSGSRDNTPTGEDLPTIMAAASWLSSNSSNSKKSPSAPLVKRGKLMRKNKETTRLEDVYEVATEKLGE